MVTIEINKHQYKVPTLRNEVTVEQYLAIEQHAETLDEIRLLSILTGIDYDSLSNLPCGDFGVLVMPELTWVGNLFEVTTARRQTKIKIGKYTVETIIDVMGERLGQKLMMQRMVNDAIKNNAKYSTLIAPVLACYYAPHLHPEKKFSESHVKEVEQLILKMPVEQAYPEANFFLRGYLKPLKLKRKR